MGIEPTLFAWEARVLPLNDTRDAMDCTCAAAAFLPKGLGTLPTRRVCRRCDAFPCSLGIYPVDGSSQSA